MNRSLAIYFAVGIGGIFGACLRYVLSFITAQAAFPWATLIVNISGAFLLPFITYISLQRKNVNEIILIGLTSGLIGSYTTFSMITIDVVRLFQVNLTQSLLYILLTMFGGLALSFFGLQSAKLFTKMVKRDD